MKKNNSDGIGTMPVSTDSVDVWLVREKLLCNLPHFNDRRPLNSSVATTQRNIHSSNRHNNAAVQRKVVDAKHDVIKNPELKQQ